MKVFNNYEISPCHRYEEPDSPGKFYFEVCEPEEADVWTLYGHIDGEGVQAIGDFATREDAEEMFSMITGIPFGGALDIAEHLRAMHAAPKMLAALENLLGDLPSVQNGHCCHCGRDYEADLTGNCPSDDCPSFVARTAIAEATGRAS